MPQQSYRNFAHMKVTTKTLNSPWYITLCQFGPDMAARALVQIIRLFDSPEGYYFTHENCPPDILDALLKTGLVSNHSGAFTSEWLQREYIRAGKAKARRNTWLRARLLSLDELLNLGIIPARQSSPDNLEFEPIGIPLDIPGHPHLAKIRIRSRRYLHVYRVIKHPTPPPTLSPPASLSSPPVSGYHLR